MVTHHDNSKTSRQTRRSSYPFESIVTPDWRLPANLEIGACQSNVFSGVLSHYALRVTLGESVNPARWRTPPHRQFTNLPLAPPEPSGWGDLIDPKAMLGFSRRYGLLHNSVMENDECLLSVERGAVTPIKAGEDNSEALRYLAEVRSVTLLRHAWATDDEQAIAKIGEQASNGLRSEIDSASGVVVVAAKDIWTLVCMLFVRDNAAGKTAVCANPECPAPYFIRNRKTQKICEAGECVQWAQRNYALKWWRENESKQAKKKHR